MGSIPTSRDELWAAVHAERAALADDLAGIDEQRWSTQSLCAGWTVEDVVAHLAAAASVGRVRWIMSVVGARGDVALHNERRLTEQRGSSPQETLQRFRRVITSTTAASGHTAAWLGEVTVHAQDIRRPLGLERAPVVEASTAVATFFASRDFAVPSRTTAAGLRLDATDGPFVTGDGPLVRGETIALVMAMAGRSAFCDDLDGPGVELLHRRLEAATT